MTEAPLIPPQPILEPIDRAFEILFGLIMVLTFTGSLSVVEAGRVEVRTMLFSALGCNLAWGIIDGAFYLIRSAVGKGKALADLRALRATTTVPQAHQLLRGALPPTIAQVMSPGELEQMCQRLKALPEPPPFARLALSEWRAAAGVSALVFLSTVPVILPFLFMSNATLALRLSNLIAIILLFFTGYTLGRIAGLRAWVWGCSLVLVGAILTGMAIALGG